MQSNRVRRLPVVGPGGLLIGIVSRTDLLSLFERPDDEIRDEVLRDVIAGEFGLKRAEFEVSVASGVVTVAGAVAELGTALALQARVRHLEGVVAVRDRLTVAEASGQLLGVLLAAGAGEPRRPVSR
jgi:CBS domain-containing protein